MFFILYVYILLLNCILLSFQKQAQYIIEKCYLVQFQSINVKKQGSPFLSHKKISFSHKKNFFLVEWLFLTQNSKTHKKGLKILFFTQKIGKKELPQNHTKKNFFAHKIHFFSHKSAAGIILLKLFSTHFFSHKTHFFSHKCMF